MFFPWPVFSVSSVIAYMWQVGNMHTAASKMEQVKAVDLELQDSHLVDACRQGEGGG